MKIDMSWILGYGAGAKGGLESDPSLVDIEYYLGKVCEARGSVTLDLKGYCGYDFSSLQVMADDRNFLLILGVDDGTDYVTRSYQGEVQREVCILGDYYDGSLVCTDAAVVFDVFRRVVSGLEVPSDILS